MRHDGRSGFAHRDRRGFGKNSDRDALEPQYIEWHQPLAVPPTHAYGSQIGQARDTHAVLLSNPHWIWRAEIGANEHGLTIRSERGALCLELVELRGEPELERELQGHLHGHIPVVVASCCLGVKLKQSVLERR